MWNDFVWFPRFALVYPDRRGYNSKILITTFYMKQRIYKYVRITRVQTKTVVSNVRLL